MIYDYYYYYFFFLSNFLLPKIGDMDLPKPLVTYSASPNSLKDEYHRDVYMGDLSGCYF